MERKNNNGIFYVVISLVAVLGIGAWVLGYSGSNVGTVFEGGCNNCNVSNPPTGSVSADTTFGAVSGPDVFFDLNIHGSLITGSDKQLATTTDAKTYTLTFKELNNYTYIDILNNDDEAGLSWTLPATSTMMQILPSVGSRRQWLIHHASTTGGTLTLLKGAGMDLVGVTTNDDVIDPGEYTQLTCTQLHYRVDDENIVCIVDELTNAD
jgi:hypothetical protein